MQQEMQQEQALQQQQAQQAQINQNVASNGALPQGAQTGNAVAPGFPQGATAYSRNGQTVPQTGVAPWRASAGAGLSPNSNLDMTYVAKRAAAYIRGLPQDRQQQTLQNMAASNPPLHQQVVNLLSSRQGDQSDPTNPMTNPLATQKPSRATPARKVGY